MQIGMRSFAVSLVSVLAIVAVSTSVAAAEPGFGEAPNDGGVATRAAATTEWCQTNIRWEAIAAQAAAGGGCPLQGACDGPAVRDSWIPGKGDPVTVIRLKFNVFANDDGSQPSATQAGVDAQLVQLNSDFAPWNIQFNAITEFINDSTYRNFADSEENAMKNAYADSPATQHNIYVVNISAGYLGVSTFPWVGDALSNGGGTIIDNNWFGAGEKTTTHEIGHALGCWHTHHGVSEVGTCSACYERADGLNGDTTGDFASDTAPTPTNFNCNDPNGNDPCSATSWAPTNPENYMGYAADACYDSFTAHQAGRMQCWINDVLSGWVKGDPICATDADCDDGLFCTGVETCEAGVCRSTGNPCTNPADCDEINDTCVVGGVTCNDVRIFRSKCTNKIKVLLRMNDNSNDGDQVVISIDGIPVAVTIVNGSVRYTTPATPGAHTVRLDEPAGCFENIVVNCGD